MIVVTQNGSSNIFGILYFLIFLQFAIIISLLVSFPHKF